MSFARFNALLDGVAMTAINVALLASLPLALALVAFRIL